MPTRDASKIILNLDDVTAKEAIRLTHQIGDRCRAVVIDATYDLVGGEAVHALKQAGAARVWVRANIHDRPKVAARRAKALATRGADGMTVHALGGVQMMEEVVKAIFTERGPAPAIYAVLPWCGVEGILSNDDLFRLQVSIELSKQAKKAHVDGIICPPQHLKTLVDHPDLQGSVWIVADLTSKHCDITPQQAIEIGADYVIVGHQVTMAEHPEKAFDAIAGSINPNAG